MTWEQITMFQQPIYKIDKPIRLIELFAGVGSQAMALRNIGADFEHWKVVEFDKYPIKSYNAIHGTDFEATDICNIHGADLEITDTDKYCYVITYSFPCQDLSVAGKGKGMSKGSGTRSGLLWEVERLIDELDLDEKSELPQVLLMENVPQVHGKKNIDDFNAWLGFLKSKGYSNHWADLNAKNYGIAQNRNRCFMVSILGNYYYEFPKAVPLKLRLKHMLEEKVDKKFYLSDETIKTIIKHGCENKELTIREATKKGYAEAVPGDSINLEQPNSKTRRGRVDKGVAQTLTTSCNQAVVEPVCLNSKGGRSGVEGLQPSMQNRIYDSNYISPALTNFKPYYTVGTQIRKFTPKECWRLMGFTDEDFHKAEQVNSNTQLYKQAGNSIVVNVLEAIFKQMIESEVKHE